MVALAHVVHPITQEMDSVMTVTIIVDAIGTVGTAVQIRAKTSNSTIATIAFVLIQL